MQIGEVSINVVFLRAKRRLYNIYFIDRFPFNKEFFIRHEFEYLEQKGYNPLFLDISKFLKRQELESNLPDYLEKYVTRFDSRKSFRSFIKENASNSVILSTVPFVGSSSWMFLSIFKNNVPFILLDNISFPTFEETPDTKVRKQKMKRTVQRLSLVKILRKPIEEFQYTKAKLTPNMAKMMITSRIEGKSRVYRFTDKNTEWRYSYSPDYKLAKQIGDARLVEGEYAVFIDQYFYHHPDFKTNHVIHRFTDEDYYPLLNKFLAEFSDKTGLKVVIASHPRRNKDQEKDFNPEFEIFYNKTAGLIKNSKVVLMHFSTAISFAVIFRKPFLLLDSDIFSGGTVGSKVNGFANYFKKKPVKMEEEYSLTDEELYGWDEEVYTLYKDTFLKHPKAKMETFGEKIDGFMKRYFTA